jgi:hypothetical protein
MQKNPYYILDNASTHFLTSLIISLESGLKIHRLVTTDGGFDLFYSIVHNHDHYQKQDTNPQKVVLQF